jgi:hypothetical protein
MKTHQIKKEKENRTKNKRPGNTQGGRKRQTCPASRADPSSRCKNKRKYDPCQEEKRAGKSPGEVHHLTSKKRGGGHGKQGRPTGKTKEARSRPQNHENYEPGDQQQHHVDTMNTKNPESKRRKCL